MLRMKNDQWYDVINVNLNSNFHIIKSILPNMVRNKKGKIMIIIRILAKKEVINFLIDVSIFLIY